MKSPSKMGENSFLGNISSSSFRNLLPRSMYAKQKSIQNSETKSFRSNDENAPPCDPNIQISNTKSPLKQKVFPSAIQIQPNQIQTLNFSQDKVDLDSNSPLKKLDEIREEDDDDQLGDQIRELKEDLLRTKSDGYKPDGGYFVKESLTQLRKSINKSLVMSREETMVAAEDNDVMELNKHIDNFHTYCGDDDDDLRDSLHSSFASASCCEAESMSEDEICSMPNGISISLPQQTRILEEPTLSESPKIRNFRKSVAASTTSNIGLPVSKKPLSPTDSLAASLQRGLQIIDSHQRSSLSNRSSVSFSFGHLSLKPTDETENLNASVVQLMKHSDGEDETEVVKDTYESNQLSEEFGKTRIDLSEKEALLKEIAELKSKLQPTKSTDNVRSSLLLRSFQMRKSTDLTKNNNNVQEEERERWTEMESEWISLTDDLRMDIDNHRRHAEDLEIELKKQKMATEELNDALSRAMLGHSRFIEQYTELQENYDELAERHHVTMAGIVDVKKAAAKAAVKGRHGKRFAKAFSAELTAIRAEKEKEREFLKKENKALKIQLRDTAEAVQAAGELLIRLREAEQYVQSSEERFSLIEEENEKLKMQMEKLKSKHKTEMSTMKQYLAESKLPGSALEPWFKENEQEEVEHESQTRPGVVSYDDYADDQAWRAEFGAIYQDHDNY